MIKAAIVGLGWWGKYIINSLAASDKIRIILAVDVNADQSRDFAAEKNLALTRDLDVALNDPEIEMVILATPHSFHEDQIIRAAKAGKQVFCEKPLCLTAASAERAIAACQAAGVKLGIGHERRFEPALVEIKRMIDAGELGTIMHVESNFSHDKLAHVAADDWRANPHDAPAAGMTGMGIHLTDAYLNMFGPIAELYAQTARRVMANPSGDVVSVQLRFASGATGYLSAILVTPLFLRFQVFGSDAWVEARNESHPDTPGVTHLTVCRAGGQPQTTTYEWIDSVRANFDSFADSITGAGDYIFTDDQKFQNVQVLEAICNSVADNAVVNLQPTGT
ncbi:MAG: Gfo/Idh/MocA family oxidoreductase [Rhodospirillales bacterium]|nr:Gfo/Idh/MocA family oxidoreductase [Rhodospirillales bacterium]